MQGGERPDEGGRRPQRLELHAPGRALPWLARRCSTGEGRRGQAAPIQAPANSRELPSPAAPLLTTSHESCHEVQLFEGRRTMGRASSAGG